MSANTTAQFEAWETEYLQREAFDGTPTGTVALFRTALEGYEKTVAADVNRKLGTTGNFFTDRNVRLRPLFRHFSLT
jgi:hypothetical protein